MSLVLVTVLVPVMVILGALGVIDIAWGRVILAVFGLGAVWLVVACLLDSYGR